MISLKTKEQQFDCCMLKLNRIIKSDIQYEALSIIRIILEYIRNGGLCMNSMLRDKINELASTVLRCYEITPPITDIAKEVGKLGGEIKEDCSLGVFSDGKIEKQGDSFSISVPTSQSSARKNFTIAHELGHLFLHMGYKIDKELWESPENKVYNRSGNSEFELQANEFAAAFLMPKELYKKVMDENTVGNTVYIAKVAKFFNVSIDAASYRGKWLGYLQW